MNFDNFNDPIISKLRKGDSEQPYKPIEEVLQVINGQVALTEIPVEFDKVTVTSVDGSEVLFEIQSGIPKENEYKVHYRGANAGVVTFHQSRNEQELRCLYLGKGIVLIPASRVYTKTKDGDVIETVDQLVINGEDVIKDMGSKIVEANQKITEVNNKITETNQKINETNQVKNATEQTRQTILTDYDNVVKQTKVIILPFVETYAQIVTTYPNPQLGWTVQVKEDGIEYRYNGQQWQPYRMTGLVSNGEIVSGSLPPENVNVLWVDEENNLKFHNSDTSQWEEVKFSTKFKEYSNKVKLTQDASNVPIGIAEYNKQSDVLFVVSNGNTLTENENYTVALTGMSINKVNGTWDKDTEFNFRVLKTPRVEHEYADGSLISRGSITDHQLAEGIKITPALTDKDGVLHASLKERLLKTDVQLAHTTTDILSRGISLENYKHLASGEDWTQAFNQAISDARGKVLIIPKKETKYKTDTLYFSHDITIMIDPSVEIEINSGLGSGKRLIEVNAGHAIIYGNYAKLRHLKSEYGNNGSESDHTIRVVGSGSFTGYDLMLLDGGGDNFYCRTSGDITLINPVCKNAYRNNISIVSANNVSIINPITEGANGTSPMAGIDIEPNLGDVLNKVYIQNGKSINNGGAGLAIQLQNSDAVGFVDINIDGYHSADDLKGFTFSNFKEVKGIAKLDKCIARKSKYSGFDFRGQELNDMFELKIVNPIVIDCNTANIGVNRESSAYTVYTPHTSTRITDQGNIIFENPTVIDTREVPLTAFAFYLFNETTGNVKNVKFLNSKVNGLPNDKLLFSNSANEDIEITYQNNPIQNILANSNISGRYLGFLLSNRGAPQRYTYTLLTNSPIGRKKFSFVVSTNQFIRIVPQSDKIIYPSHTVTGKFIESNVIGSTIELEFSPSIGHWVITNQTGTWVLES